MQLETPNDITLKADDAELARTTLLSAKGATCAAAGAPRLRVDKHVVPRRRATRDCCKVERWPQHLNNPALMFIRENLTISNVKACARNPVCGDHLA